jgi:PAS domain S-box-containing protein
MKNHPCPVNGKRSNTAYPSVEQLQQLFDSSLDVICSIDAEGRFLHVSQASFAVWGYQPHELIGERYMDFVVTEDHPLTEAVATRVIGGDKIINFENRYYRKDGTIVPISWSAHWDIQTQLMFCIARDATVLKEKEAQKLNYEKEIRRHRDEMQHILERINDGFIALDKNFTITYWNQPAENILLRKRDEVLGKNIWDCFPDAVNTHVYWNYHKAMADQVAIAFTEYFPPLNAWYDIKVHPSNEGLTIFFNDVTEQKKWKEELVLSNERFRLAAKHNAVYDFDLVLNKLHWGQGVQELFGYHPESLQMQQWEAAVHPDDVKQTTQDFYQTLEDKSKNSWTAHYRFQKNNGQYSYVEEHGEIVRDSEGNAVRMVGVIQDISERKKTEGELQKLALIARQTKDAVAFMDRENRITWVNSAFTKMTGYILSEALGKTPFELLEGPKTDTLTAQTIQEQYHLGKRFQGEVLNYKKNGQTFWTELHIQPLYDAQGKVEQFFSIRKDITERKLATDKLQTLSLIAEQTKNLVVLTDREGHITWTNKAFTDVTGYTIQEAIGKKPGALLQGPESDPDTIRFMSRQIREGNAFKVEMLNYTKAKQPYWLEISCQPIYDQKGALTSFFAIQTDISERKRMEKALIEEEHKRQQMMTAAAITAQEKERTQVSRELHDNVNQILTSVKLYQELILTGIGNRDELATKSSRLLQQVIDEIRNISKRLSAPTLGNIRLKESVNELVDNIAATNRFQISLHTSLIDDLEISEELHLGLYRILQEHLTNITRYADASLVDVSLHLLDEHLILKVVDDGKGFDPLGKSNGIGITNMHSRAKSMHGSLKINSAPGLGCVLIATFPLESVEHDM